MTHTPSELAWQDAERAAARWVRKEHHGVWQIILRNHRLDRGLPGRATKGRPPKTTTERQPI